MASGTTLGSFVFLSALMAASPACERCGVNRAPEAARREPVSGLGREDLRVRPAGKSEHRLLLDARALDRLRESAKARTPAWRTVQARCDEALARPMKSGYEAFDWADALASLSLCWHATGNHQYATAAAGYLRALLDDRFEMGDRKGGARVVEHDSGYGIRTFGAYSALGYDWLRGAPEMDSELEAKVAERLGQWLDWYGKKGYLRDAATANYYWGYLTTLAFAGLSLSGRAKQADAWLELARKELAERALPALRDDLRGGGWPEGWQYGEYTALEIALVAESFRTGAGVNMASKLPWLADIVPHHMHGLLPHEGAVYDGGSWSEHPAKPSALALHGVAIALDGVNERRAAEARWLTAKALPPQNREHAWVALLADYAGSATRDPRAGAPTSLHLEGQGLTFVRSDWQKSAVWASFQAGPWLAADHQDKDQGHFTLWRGKDALLVDAGDYEGGATINHNTLLVDDLGKRMDYPPNQGVWGKNVRTTRFGDDGAVVVAVGDIGESYAPKCVREGCRERSVHRLVRSFVFVRPSLLVIEDRVELDSGGFGATWAAHVVTDPAIAGNRVSATVGDSRVDVALVDPERVTIRALREPTASGEGPHRKNSTWGPTWRIEADSPRGAKERRFIAFVSADRKDAKPPAVTPLSGEGLRGAVSQAGGKATAVLFASGADLRAALDGAEVVVIAGLEPGKRYQARFEPDAGCSLRLTESSDASAQPANAGGFLRLSTDPCRRK